MSYGADLRYGALHLYGIAVCASHPAVRSDYQYFPGTAQAVSRRSFAVSGFDLLSCGILFAVCRIVSGSEYTMSLFCAGTGRSFLPCRIVLLRRFSVSVKFLPRPEDPIYSEFRPREAFLYEFFG